MLSIAAIRSGSEDYYLRLGREDYYLNGGEPPGLWMGRGARSLGLCGQVTEAHLKALFLGFGPDGRPLVKNAGKMHGFHSRQPGWDLTFSAPKSVSVLWSQASPEIRLAIQRAHLRSVQAALSYLERETGYVRRGKGGTDWLRASVVVATFEHGTSRALEPQLHTHALLLNVGVLPDGTTGSLVSKLVYRHKMAAGALYRAQFSREILNLGFAVRRERDWFEVKAIPKAVMRMFSTRRQQIEQSLKDRKLETASAAAAAALNTRPIKEFVPPRGELFSKWRSDLQEQGWRVDVTPKPQHPVPDLDAIVTEAIERLQRSKEVFAQRDVIAAVAVEAQGTGATAADVQKAVATALRRQDQLVSVGSVEQEDAISTRQAIDRMHDLIAIAESGKDVKTFVVNRIVVEQYIIDQASTPSTLQAVISKSGEFIRRRVSEQAAKRPTHAVNEPLSDDQAAAVRLLTTGAGNIQILAGEAGTGKTRTIRACQELWEKAGFEVIGVAIAGRAARQLADRTGIPCFTLAMLKVMTSDGVGKRLKHAARQLTRAALGRSTYDFSKLLLGKGKVLVVDEAAMLGSQQLYDIIGWHVKKGGKLVLVGDDAQIPPIEAGCPFRKLKEVVPTATLTTVIRQKDEQDRIAAQHIRNGRIMDAINNYKERGRFFAAESVAEAMERLVQDWTAHGLKRPADTLILCPTREQASEINQKCQAERCRHLFLMKTQSVRVDGTRFIVGDRVLFTKPSRVFGVENGSLGTITSLGILGSSINVRLDDGRRITVPTRRPPRLRSTPHYWEENADGEWRFGLGLGYAMTSHRGQGATAKHVYSLLDGPGQSKQMAYVQASRGQLSTRLYTGSYDPKRKLAGLVSQLEQDTPNWTLSDDRLKQTQDRGRAL